MYTSTSPRIPFAELPSEARALFYIFASGAAAKFLGRSPAKSALVAMLSHVWDEERLTKSDLADPFRMTRLLEQYFDPTSKAYQGNRLVEGEEVR
jgi:hypothetical protein